MLLKLQVFAVVLPGIFHLPGEGVGLGPNTIPDEMLDRMPDIMANKLLNERTPGRVTDRMPK